MRWYVVLDGQIMYSGKNGAEAIRLTQQYWADGKIVFASDAEEAIEKAA